MPVPILDAKPVAGCGDENIADIEDCAGCTGFVDGAALNRLASSSISDTGPAEGCGPPEAESSKSIRERSFCASEGMGFAAAA